MDTRSLDKVTQDDPQVHTESYDSQIECLKDIISGLKAEIERHDKECNLTRQQEIERLRKKQDELWKATKDLGELRQFLSTVKTEIDSMHRMMPAPEQAACVEKKIHALRTTLILGLETSKAKWRNCENLSLYWRPEWRVYWMRLRNPRLRISD
ncbi:hypothetical protein FOTG_18429 [Fusarium oxysporum f. sp. vasinfectum 25433]|uniref:Uncharacterized protein n=1 Tax=Fusarium oxysporum f. sp. vasinfectum 25433 TaxID=1089449 RepID=X0LX99_FUSOX|nr:hypothetical protein FOTG_18429 [Fusarium oxysporum f. sp. vasinfectum 25433]